jgi:hypothetical protein
MRLLTAVIGHGAHLSRPMLDSRAPRFAGTAGRCWPIWICSALLISAACSTDPDTAKTSAGDVGAAETVWTASGSVPAEASRCAAAVPRKSYSPDFP